MTTTLLEKHSERSRAAANAVRPSAGEPRHLALALNGGPQAVAPSVTEAAGALRALLKGCVERGVAVLTLVAPDAAELSPKFFEEALAQVKAELAGARQAGVSINIGTARDGRAELLEAVRRAASEAQAGKCSPESIGAKQLEAGLSTSGLPAVDLLISTGGGARLDGVLLWQCAYAELLFLDCPWHAFSRGQFDQALADYAGRCRKFGGLA